MNSKQKYQSEESDLYSANIPMSGEGIIFGPIHFQNTQEGLRHQLGCRPDLEARGPLLTFWIWIRATEKQQLFQLALEDNCHL